MVWARKNKHGNKRVTFEGLVFDSKRELARYHMLCLHERQGAIQCLRRQVAYVLAPPIVLNGRKKPALRYFADFVYTQDGKEIIEDAKSPHLQKDPVYRLKKHLMKSVLGLDITET